MRNPDKFRGCLIGGAAGDALGYTVEFKREPEIFKIYGEQGITSYDLGYGRALISDDTQMTLFTAAGLLCAETRAAVNGTEADYTAGIRESYWDWLATQNRRFSGHQAGHVSWLMNIRDLYDRRAPGTTCISALKSGRLGTVEEPINTSKGCGGVMRVAPIGLFFNGRNTDVQTIARLGAEAAAITHGHILGWLPAAVLVQVIHEVSQDDTGVPDAVRHALDTVKEMWPESEKRAYFIELTEKALALAREDISDLDAIHRLGGGWVGEEALAIAVYCAARYEHDFDKALISSVNHSGDSDSTGAITGNILGARLGLEGIPEKYKEKLELSSVILEIADDLYRGCPAKAGEAPDPEWQMKYIEATWTGKKDG